MRTGGKAASSPGGPSVAVGGESGVMDSRGNIYLYSEGQGRDCCLLTSKRTASGGSSITVTS